jgi:hypothetical protein
VEFLLGDEAKEFRYTTLTTAATIKTKVLKRGYQKAVKFASYFARDSEAFIINSQPRGFYRHHLKWQKHPARYRHEPATAYRWHLGD